MEKNQSGGGEIKSSEIRSMLKNVQQKRKVENRRNTKAYFLMINYMTQRTESIYSVLPQQLEI